MKDYKVKIEVKIKSSQRVRSSIIFYRYPILRENLQKYQKKRFNH